MSGCEKHDWYYFSRAFQSAIIKTHSLIRCSRSFFAWSTSCLIAMCNLLSGYWIPAETLHEIDRQIWSFISSVYPDVSFRELCWLYVINTSLIKICFHSLSAFLGHSNDCFQWLLYRVTAPDMYIHEIWGSDDGVKITVFMDVMPCSLVEGGSRFLSNYHIHLANHTASHPRRTYFWYVYTVCPGERYQK
jgi:hypothetical protein